MSRSSPFAAGAAVGAAVAVAARALLPRLLMVKFRRDLYALNRGDHKPLLAGYHPDAVLRFNDGEHRWAGVHRGRDAIEVFLRDFVAAGLKGELVEVLVAGAPWRMTMAARFDDHADGPDGSRLYANRVVLLVRTRWGRIVEHEDFYEDTARISAFDLRLRELGIEPVAR
jgi:ketosteroid isomerase-like protein